MIKFINSWAQGIILAVIIATIIEIILPEGNNKKYIKTVIGIYILFSIVYPLITKLSNKTINFNSIVNNLNKEIKTYDNNFIALETDSYIENTYKNNLEEDIKNKLQEKGYVVLNLDLYIETKNEKKYGQINSIVIELENNNKAEIKKSSSINKIENININVLEKNTIAKKSNEEISKDEIDMLKEYINNIYQLEKEKIHINE